MDNKYERLEDTWYFYSSKSSKISSMYFTYFYSRCRCSFFERSM